MTLKFCFKINNSHLPMTSSKSRELRLDIMYLHKLAIVSLITVQQMLYQL